MLAAQVSSLFLSLVDAFLRPSSPLTQIVVTGTTAASTALTALGDMTGVEIGAVVTGANIVDTPPTTIVAIDNAANTGTLSQAATGAGVAEPITFTNPPIMTAPVMGLYTNVITATSATLLADLTEPTYPGYARQALAINPVKIDALGNYIQDYASAHFQPTGTWGGGVPCLGYFVGFTYGGATVLMYSENFPAPVNLLVATDSTDILFDGYVSNLKTWGGFCATC